MRNNTRINDQTKQRIIKKCHEYDAFAADVNFFCQTEEVKSPSQNVGTNYLCTQDEFWKKQLYKNSAKLS